MKRLFLLTLVLSCVYSCQNDDDNSVAQCENPLELSASDITHTSATLHWENSNTVTEVTVEFGITGFTLGTGTTVTTSENSITINTLNPDASYEFYVQAICSVDNNSMVSDAGTFNTIISPVVPQFLPMLSQLNIFSGDLADLIPSANTFKYELSTELHTDYAHKLRLIALPNEEPMTYNGDGFPIFPNGTVLSKTFYYNLDETDMSAGRTIIETRVLIRQSNVWHIGNYLWNEAQDDAVLDEDAHIVPITWIDELGNEISADYEVPNYFSCVMCHQNNGSRTPIGPRLRTMNFDVAGNNQLQTFIDQGYLTNAPDPSTIAALPSWEDDSFSDEARTRAYFDVNCAHCHSPGGYHNMNYFDAMDLRYETSFDDSNIFFHRYSMLTRLPSSIPGYSMPFIGVTIPHSEALDLIIPYLESLE